MAFSVHTDDEKGCEVADVRVRGGDFSRCFSISLRSLVKRLSSMIGQNAVVFPPFSPAVRLKIEAIVRFT